MSKKQHLADELRRKNKNWSHGYWNVWNTSNRQIIKRFANVKDENTSS